MRANVRKKASKYFASSPLARFHSTNSTKSQAEAPSSTEEALPPGQPNRVIMGVPNISFTSHMPSVPDIQPYDGRDSGVIETPVSAGPLASETYGSEIVAAPGMSKLRGGEDVGSSNEQCVEGVTVTFEPCCSPQQSIADTFGGTTLPILKSSLLRPPPTLPERNQVSPTTYSSEVVPPLQSDGAPLAPIGKWRCCRCERTHDIYYFTEGDHPISILNCECAHRSCGKCMLRGQMKVFQPMAEPEIVQLSEDGLRHIRFGVFCDACGLSWRAVEVVTDETDKKSLAQHLSDMPKHLIRHAYPLRKLRQHRSMADLSAHAASTAAAAAAAAAEVEASHESPPRFQSSFNLRALSHEMEAEGHGKQAECAAVHFTGIQCTCGFTTCASSLCFQVVDPPKDVYEARFEQLMAERRESAGFGTTLDDQARGHQMQVLRLKGGPHPNPLRSSPVI